MVSGKLNEFGSSHSETKLNCVKSYLDSWANVMSSTPFNRRYIDAFSGSGHFAFRIDEPDPEQSEFIESENEDGRKFLEGSALRAFDVSPAFHQIDLIEKSAAAAQRLSEAVEAEKHPHVRVHVEDANTAIPRMCQSFDRLDRAVLFLDPFGAQVQWKTLEAIANTKAVDLWYLLPVSILNRLMARNPEKISTGWKARITNCVGTDDWYDRFYEKRQTTDLFGHVEEVAKTGSLIEVEKFFIERLKTVFPGVADECVRLVTPKGTHLFSLCFAVANPRGNAPEIAVRIADAVIKRWGGGKDGR